MSFCLSCGAKLSPSSRFCTSCGKVKAASTEGGAQWTAEEAKNKAREEALAKRQELIKHQQELEAQRASKFTQYRDAPQCTKCGARLTDTTRFCTGCGTPRKTLEQLGLSGSTTTPTPTSVPSTPVKTPTPTPTPAPKPDDRAELEKKRLAMEKAENDKKKEIEEKEKREREEKDKKEKEKREKEDRERKDKEDKQKKEAERQKQQIDATKDKEEKEKKDKADRERKEKEERERKEKERREKESASPPPPEEPHPDEEEEEEEEEVELDEKAKERILKGLQPPSAAEIKARAGSSADQRREERLADLYGKARFRSLGRILAIGNKVAPLVSGSADTDAKALAASLQPDISLQQLRVILLTLNTNISKEEWVEEFLQAEGLAAFATLLDRIYNTIGSDELISSGNKNKNGQLSSASQLLETLLECLEVLSTDESTLEPMSTTPKMINRIVACLNVIHSSIHVQVYNIASMLCLAGDSGKQVLDSFELIKTKTRYGLLVSDLELVLATNGPMELELKLTCVTLVNSLLDSEANLKGRMTLRQTFDSQGIKAKVDALSTWVEKTREKHDLHDPDKLDELESHTEHYETAANTDEREANLNELDLHDPEAVFQVLLENTEADGYSAVLLSILQLLLTIPARKDLAQSIWNNVQFMVNTATGREKSADDDDDGEQRFMDVEELRKLLMQKEELDSQTIGSYVGSLEEQNSKLKQENRQLREALDGKGIAPPLPGEAPPMDAPPMDAPPMDAPPMDAPPMDDGGGPPPPPPLLDGPPGAPVLADDGPKLPPRPKLKPNKKMKKFHWAVVTPKEMVTEGENFWMKVLKENVENEFKLDFNDLEENFGAKVIEKKEETKERKGLKGPQKVERINLIDPKRAYNVDIGLARFRMSHLAIRDAILSMDEVLLNQERLAPLIKLMPTNEELEIIRTFAKSDDATKLTSAGQFFHALSEITGFPDLTTRLELFLFKQQFQTIIEGIDVKLDQVKKVADTCRNSAHLKKIFTLILLIGNYLNGGTNKGEAYGFKLSALTQLKATKTSDNKMTMIHYLADYVNKNCPEVRKFVDDLKDIKEVAELEETATEQDIARIRTMLSHSKKALQLAMDHPVHDDSFQRIMITFDAQANIKFAQLLKKFEAAQASSTQLGTYFGEKKGSLKWEELFQRFHTFVESYEKAERQLEKIKKEEEKRKRMEEEKEARDKRREEKKNKEAEGDDDDGSTLKKVKKGKKGGKSDKDGISLGKIKRRKKGNLVKRIKKSAKTTYDRVLRSGVADDDEEDYSSSKKGSAKKKKPAASGPCDNFTVDLDDADRCGNCGLGMTDHSSKALDQFLKGTLDLEVAAVEKTARMELKDIRLSAEEERQIKSATSAFGARLRKVAPRGGGDDESGGTRSRGRIKVTLRKSAASSSGGSNLLPPSASFHTRQRSGTADPGGGIPTSASFTGGGFGFQPTLRKVGEEGKSPTTGAADFKSTLKPTTTATRPGATTAEPAQQSFLGVLKKKPDPVITTPTPQPTTTTTTPPAQVPPSTPEKSQPSTPIITTTPSNFDIPRSRSSTDYASGPPTPSAFTGGSLGAEPIVEEMSDPLKGGGGSMDEETKAKIEEEEKRKESELRRLALEQKKAAAQARLEALQKAKEKALVQREEALKKEAEAKKTRTEAERRVSMMQTGKVDPKKAAAAAAQKKAAPTKRFCTVCGSRMPPGGARFCTGCGTKVT